MQFSFRMTATTDTISKSLSVVSTTSALSTSNLTRPATRPGPAAAWARPGRPGPPVPLTPVVSPYAWVVSLTFARGRRGRRLPSSTATSSSFSLSSGLVVVVVVVIWPFKSSFLSNFLFNYHHPFIAHRPAYAAPCPSSDLGALLGPRRHLPPRRQTRRRPLPGRPARPPPRQTRHRASSSALHCPPRSPGRPRPPRPGSFKSSHQQAPTVVVVEGREPSSSSDPLTLHLLPAIRRHLVA